MPKLFKNIPPLKAVMTLTREIYYDNVTEFQLAVSHQWGVSDYPYVTKTIKVPCEYPRPQVIDAMIMWAKHNHIAVTKEELEELFCRLDRAPR
jgi:hypothetical protein